jgi:hypothetical protein
MTLNGRIAPIPALGSFCGTLIACFSIALGTSARADSKYLDGSGDVFRVSNFYVIELELDPSVSLHRRYPASAVLRTSPPPQGAQPVPHGLPVGHR